VNIFDLSGFVNCGNQSVICTKLAFSDSKLVPSTRWGHTAAVYDDKLFVLGGRNDHDVNDLYRLDLETNHWTKLESSS
jgi:hypothetical protein